MWIHISEPIGGWVRMAENRGQGDEFVRGDSLFALQSFREGSTQILVLAGDLDISTAGELATGLAQAEATSAAVILVDLRRLEFIDSSGLDVIDEAHHRIHERLLLIRGPRQVQRPFELCGLIDVLTFVARPPHHPGPDPSPKP